jgi:hypothetical protein
MIDPNSHAPLVNGAMTLNRPRSRPLTIDVIEVRPRTAVPAGAASAAFVATPDWPACRASAGKLGATLTSATMKNDSVT